jgi:transcriptional regulator with XRE-family HTH domain
MDKALAQSIGNAARQARRSLQLTQEDAAERLGVSVEFYSRIERGAALPSLQTFVRMASVLNVSSDVMIGRSTSGERPAPAASGLQPSQREERPEVRRVVRRLRHASPGTLRFVTLLLKEMERVHGGESVADDDA